MKNRGAYYSEFEPYAAEWLRNLIKANVLPPGEVDERDLWDVSPDDLKGFAQVHLCAGIGIWPGAARSLGWSDDYEYWSASFPCQPFSAAGEGKGFADERHLWPAGFHLIRERRPAIVLGEQVASRDAEPWVDLVQSDLEALGYTFGCLAFPSAGVGAPILRDRAYWMASTKCTGLERHRTERELQRAREEIETGGRRKSGDVGKSERNRRQTKNIDSRSGQAPGGVRETSVVRMSGGSDDLAGPDGEIQGRWRILGPGEGVTEGVGSARERPSGLRETGASDPLKGFWRDADWLGCRDGKFRPVEPGTFPLVDGHSGRVGQLRAYGNALNFQAARAFLEVAKTFLP